MKGRKGKALQKLVTFLLLEVAPKMFLKSLCDQDPITDYQLSRGEF